ncbi:putative L-ascorbate peroxidase 6 isoform X2 [Manihot esculenta]|uniref:putative L-ascorbate peroxidase 6 isoform X2 n=1 Tax=Manihot esculenta TaxID=3983 RepID=UPI001CC6054F|nr:putative L-ascorbate peroxidase 6 isoform X2 [Manihot esculenta]
MASLTILPAKAPLVSSIPSSSSHLEFKFPVKLQHSSLSTVKFRLKPLQARFIPATGDEDSGENLDWVSKRRRNLICVSTLPFLFHFRESFEGFSAEAAELDATYMLMKEEVRKVVSKGKAPGVLRLVFHDAGTFETDGNSGGMNGSIVFELDRPENAGLKKSLKKAKSEVDSKQSVSWADMIAVAGAEAVSICGGPTIPVILGRRDSVEPDAEGRLPEESLGASALKQCFKRKGLSTQVLVALSGAHTLGSKGFGNPFVFDNSYYKILLEKPWNSSDKMASMIGLPSDHALVEDDECLRWIKKYADDQDIFFEDFKNAYIKLVNSGARWKSL